MCFSFSRKLIDFLLWQDDAMSFCLRQEVLFGIHNFGNHGSKKEGLLHMGIYIYIYMSRKLQLKL